MASQAGFYGNPFQAHKGLTQGGVASPTIFNIVCDAVVREWFHILNLDGNGNDVKTRTREILIEWHQVALNHLIPLFERVGLKTNATKTKAMNFVPGSIRTQISTEAYRKRSLDEGLDYRARRRRRVECPHCQLQLQEGSLPNHFNTVHGILSGLQNLPPPC